MYDLAAWKRCESSHAVQRILTQARRTLIYRAKNAPSTDVAIRRYDAGATRIEAQSRDVAESWFIR
jgi:hypothetical protein